jgi:hypothetical protein
VKPGQVHPGFRPVWQDLPAHTTTYPQQQYRRCMRVTKTQQAARQV